jgi:hypothetical protein
VNLYLLSQTVNTDYENCTDIVVAAESEERAKLIGPYGIWPDDWELSPFPSWAFNPEQVMAEFLGVAKEGTTEGIVLASYK